jgi:hypothetical protein
VRRLALVFTLACCALGAPGLAHAAPTIQRPNPLFVGIRLDYINPLPTPKGSQKTAATLEPVQMPVIQSSVTDLDGLRYQSAADLGYFIRARKGDTFAAGGRRLVGLLRRSQIPLYGVYAHTKVRSYTWVRGFPSGAFPLGEGGASFVAGLGVPPEVPPPTNGNTTPPPNQGFAGNPGGTTTVSVTTTVPSGTTGTTTTGKTTTTPPPTTTAPPTTTVPATLSETTTTTPTTTGGGGGGGGSGGDCGTIDVSVTSDLSCLFILTNAKPGDSIVENYTIVNTGTQGYDLALRISNDNPPNNHLWDDLTMGIWETPGAAPNPFPPLNDWVPSYITLDHLDPGTTVNVRVECLLPATAGNSDMNAAAVMTLNWKVTG